MRWARRPPRPARNRSSPSLRASVQPRSQLMSENTTLIKEAPAPSTAGPAAVATPDRRLDRLPPLADGGVFIATAALIVLALVFVPEFGAQSNIRNVLQNMSFVGMVALGMTFVVAAGKY